MVSVTYHLSVEAGACDLGVESPNSVCFLMALVMNSLPEIFQVAANKLVS